MRDISDEVRRFNGDKKQTRESQKIYNGWERGDLTPEMAHTIYHRKPYDGINENSKIKVKKRLKDNVSE